MAGGYVDCRCGGGPEASLQLGADVVAALRRAGVVIDLRGRFRWSHAFVGVQGAAPGVVLEDASLWQPAQVQVGPALDGPLVFGQLRAITVGETPINRKDAQEQRRKN